MSRCIRGAIFQFSRGIESNVAERARSGLPLLRRGSNRLVERRQRRRRRNRQKKIGGIYGRSADAVRLRTQAFGALGSKISQRKSIGGSEIKTPRVLSISGTLVGTPEPIQRVLHVTRGGK